MLMDTTDNARPGIEELYESATNTSNLKQDPERRMPVDTLRDMAMSTNRLGAALQRLRAQWESTVRPERQIPRSVKTFERELGSREKAIDAHAAEKWACDASYDRALTSLANRLAHLEPVRDELTAVVMKRKWGAPVDPIARTERTERREQDEAMLAQLRAEMEAAEDDDQKVAAQAALNHCIIETGRQRAEEDREDCERASAKVGQVIRYWLDQTCGTCRGTRWEVIAWTNRQGTKACKACAGSGFAPVPHGSEGKWLANHMDQCVHRYQEKIKVRRRALGSIPAIDRLSKRMQPDDMKD